ncbi:MAG TPA: condensation domain-containing protein [Natronosporangium sp.]|nr:condensation domain-containing protein [Natronosporangium sp.]
MEGGDLTDPHAPAPATDPDLSAAALPTLQQVEFAAGSGPPLTAPLTWGQRAIWDPIRWFGEDANYFNISTLLPVPRGASLSDVTRAVRMVIERHEGLRTRYRTTPAGPTQEIHATGVFPVPVWEAPEGGVTAFAAAVLRDLAAATFREQEWGWRCAVVTQQGVPRRLAVVFNHQVADGWASRLVTTQLAEALRGAAAAAGTPWQPSEQVAYERTGEGARRGEISLRAWRRELRTVPRSMFDFPARTPASPRFWKLAMTSRAAAVAAQLIAERAKVTTSAVLLAASAAVLGAFTGHRRVVMQLIVANRFDPARRSLVAPMAQDGLFVLDLGGAGFDQTAQRAYRSALTSYRYSYYDPAAMADLRREYAAQRGGHLDLSVYFNDARFQDRWVTTPRSAPPPEALAELTPATTVDVVGKWARQDAKFFISTVAIDTCVLNILTDTAFVPPDQAEALLRAVEALLLRAAVADEDASTLAASLVTGVRRGPGWVECDHGWVDLHATRTVLREALGEPRLGLFAEPAATAADTQHRLVAYLAAADPVTPAQLHATCLAAVGTRTDVLTPHEYVVCAGAPADPSDLAGWRRQPVRHRGNGRELTPAPG